MTQTAFLIGLYVAALIIFCTTTRRLPILSSEALHRVSSLDGLRGILATAVAVHHFLVVYYWHTTGMWQTTDSRLINNMGAVAVTLFFMITGYLFTRKVQNGAMDWGQVLVSRLLRIWPMYLFSVGVIVAIAFYQTAGTLAPVADTLSGIGHWLLFVGKPVNGFEDTARINASVQWTLLYETVFYLCLPLLYCVLKRKVPIKALLVGLILLACLWPVFQDHVSSRFMRIFLAGIAVALLEDWFKSKSFNYKNLRWTALAAGLLIISLFVKSYTKVQLFLLMVPFGLLVLGNNLHGLLEHRGLKILGEISFSIYLLHGIVIYIMFSVFSLYDFSHANLTVYALYLIPVIIVTASISVLTYWFIERPVILTSKKFSYQRKNNKVKKVIV